MAGEAARRAQRALLRDRCSCMHGVLGCGALVRMLMRIDMHNASGRNTRIWLYSHALAYTCRQVRASWACQVPSHTPGANLQHNLCSDCKLIIKEYVLLAVSKLKRC